MSGGAGTASTRPTWDGLHLEALARAWGVPSVEAWDAVGSTNDRARTLLAAGAESRTVVVADRQTAGRGRRGRVWASPRGGLWMSVVLRHAGPLPPVLPLRVGLGVARAVEPAGRAGSALVKWPNDVLVGEAKVAGVLCEAVAGLGVLIGIGVNVTVEPSALPDAVRQRAGSLRTVYGSAPARAELAGRILMRLKDLPGPETLGREELAALRRRDALHDRAVGTEDGRGGRGRGFESDGAYRVEDGDGAVHRIRTGALTDPGAAEARIPERRDP